MRFERITIDPAKMGGLPCIRGLRIPVASVVDRVAAGLSVEAIIEDFPQIERADIVEALRFESAAFRDRQHLQVAS